MKPHLGSHWPVPRPLLRSSRTSRDLLPDRLLARRPCLPRVVGTLPRVKGHKMSLELVLGKPTLARYPRALQPGHRWPVGMFSLCLLLQRGRCREIQQLEAPGQQRRQTCELLGNWLSVTGSQVSESKGPSLYKSLLQNVLTTPFLQIPPHPTALLHKMRLSLGGSESLERLRFTRHQRG